MSGGENNLVCALVLQPLDKSISPLKRSGG
jgi:hypothetical protein